MRYAVAVRRTLRLIAIGERQQGMLEEIRRDARQTQRLWTHLARTHGWLDDQEFDGQLAIASCRMISPICLFEAGVIVREGAG